MFDISDLYHFVYISEYLFALLLTDSALQQSDTDFKMRLTSFSLTISLTQVNQERDPISVTYHHSNQ